MPWLFGLDDLCSSDYSTDHLKAPVLVGYSHTFSFARVRYQQLNMTDVLKIFVTWTTREWNRSDNHEVQQLDHFRAKQKVKVYCYA